MTDTDIKPPDLLKRLDDAEKNYRGQWNVMFTLVTQRTVFGRCPMDSKAECEKHCVEMNRFIPQLPSFLTLQGWNDEVFFAAEFVSCQPIPWRNG